MTKRGETELIRVGELALVQHLVPKYPKPTKAQVDFVEAATAIRMEPEAVERAFMARQLVLCTLPHTDPGDSPRWLRRTGNQSLIIQPGWDGEKDVSFGYPYGVIPRLILFWITTAVQHTKNRTDMTPLEKRTLQLGRSLNEFMRVVGLSPYTGGGKRGDSKRLHVQMNRLFNSRISFQEAAIAQSMRGRRTKDMSIAPESELWWDIRQPSQGTLWNSWIRLGEDFYEALIAMPVPVDMRALRALKRSPLALDLYAWLCYRVFVIYKKQQPPQFTAWESLMAQLGTDYSDVKDFKKKAKAALRKIQSVYPGLSIGKANGGFTIHAKRLAIAPKSDS